MRSLYYSRRTFIAVSAILVLGLLGWFKGQDVALAIATVAVGIAGSNAWEGAKTPPPAKAAQKIEGQPPEGEP